TTATAIHLTAGSHSVTVTDFNGCTTTANVNISGPAAALTATATQASPVLCFNGNTGSATASPTGGTPAYTYLWDDAETTATAIHLTAGSHSVTVTDFNGCT